MIFLRSTFLFVTIIYLSTTSSFAQDANNQQKIDVSNNAVQKSVLLDKIEEAALKNLPNKKPISLMFDDSEIEAIERAIDSFRNGKAYLPEEEKESAGEIGDKRSYIYLASIMYLSPEYWAVWINGEKITSESNHPGNELYLQDVQRDKISVLWTISASKWKIFMGRKSEELANKINSQNQVEAKFELKPNQTYLLTYDSVVEGNAETNDSLIKKDDEAPSNKPSPSFTLAPPAAAFQ